MVQEADILIIGGGLAGLTAGIHLAKHKLRVFLIEKQTYPQHKVCGEYISNEVLPYLEQLGIDVGELNPSRIEQFLFSTVSGKTIESQLPLGGFGVSRYTFDQFLARKARLAGVEIIHGNVADVQFGNDRFTVDTSDGNRYTTQLVVGAYGKRSALDKQLQRNFMAKASPWIGVKAHYRAGFPENLVALHNFEGGYCGLCQVEDSIVNACYLVSYQSFKAYKNIEAFQQQVLGQNPFLRQFFKDAVPLFEKPLTISQISFARKQPVENHMLMCGDTAGLIYPLCGNGMAMAIHSAKLASELIIRYLHGELPDRSSLEKQYAAIWNQTFKKRVTMGRAVQSLLQSPPLSATLLNTLQLLPGALPLLIRQTHGKPVIADAWLDEPVNR